ncbi:MAG: hypothetical protein WBD67_08090 [Terracidiphilus sp.]
MAGKKLMGAVLLLVCGGIFVSWGSQIAHSKPLGMLDFKPLYFGTGSLIQHHDPYDQAVLQKFYMTHGGFQPSDRNWERFVLTLFNNLPTVFPVIAPLALLSWGIASSLWLYLLASSLVLATFLTWSQSWKDAPLLSALLLGFLISNSEITLGDCNTAGLVVGLSAIAVWLFLRQRLAAIGVVFLAVGLAIKPHDAGLIWLFFLLSGGGFRKRALWVLAADLLLGIVAVVWIAHVAPHWLQELRSNIAVWGARDGGNYPGIGVPGPHTRNFNLAVWPGMVIGLQTILAPLWDEPLFYNLLTYLICGPMVVTWIVTVVRSRYSLMNAYLAIAAVVPLTLLVTYHRTTDAKMLLLTVPACALLWAEGGRVGKFALFLTTLGIVLTGDITLTILGMMIGRRDWFSGGLLHKIGLVILTRPVPLVLLAMAVFYLWVYVKRAGGAGQSLSA